MKDVLIFIMTAMSQTGIAVEAIAACLRRRRTKKATADEDATVSG
jgi:phosphoribosyl-ATP pyrophosphohydrolase